MSFLKKHWVTILLVLLIIWACLMKVPDITPRIKMTDLDKLVHFLMFSILGGCVYFENTAYFRKAISCQQIVWGSFLFPIVFSGLIEILQEYLTPYRTGDWMDFLWDVIGAFFTLAVCLTINRKISAKN